MKKDDLSRAVTAIAEIAAVAGIALLAYELHQNNRLLRTQATLARLQNRVAAYDSLISNDSLAAAVLKDRGGQPLSPLEALQLESFYSDSFSKWEWEYEQYLDGTDPTVPVQDWRAVFRSYPGMGRLWADEAYRQRYSPEYVRFLNEEVVAP